MRRRTRFTRVAAERGSVTAEFAIALPAVLAVFALGEAGVALAGRAVLLTDAASVVARAASRGENPALPPSAPVGTRVLLSTSGGVTCATVSVVAMAGPIAVPLTARSCALGTG